MNDIVFRLCSRLARCAMFAVLATTGSCSGDTAPMIATRRAVTPGESARVTAAARFTREYAHSQFAKWKVAAVAAGEHCNVLVIGTAITMEGSMVEAMHRGASEYGIGGEGVQRFYLEKAFRGVAYRDASGRIWTYGAVKESEVGELTPCR
jgi:hypothetical protein